VPSSTITPTETRSWARHLHSAISSSAADRPFGFIARTCRRADPSRPSTIAYLTSVNRSGQSIGWSRATPGTYAAWQLNTLTTQPSVEVSADNGTIGRRSVVGSASYSSPTIWRCG
jgi:hypothetical protein